MSLNEQVVDTADVTIRHQGFVLLETIVVYNPAHSGFRHSDSVCPAKLLKFRLLANGVNVQTIFERCKLYFRIYSN